MEFPAAALSLRILLAEDDPDDRFFFEKALKKVSVKTELTISHDGVYLMNYLFENSSNLPDVIFLDENMPRKRGSECLVEIKNNNKLKKLPVIIYSTHVHDDFADVLYENGACYLIRKTNFAQLVRILNEILPQVATRKLDHPLRSEFIIRTID